MTDAYAKAIARPSPRLIWCGSRSDRSRLPHWDLRESLTAGGHLAQRPATPGHDRRERYVLQGGDRSASMTYACHSPPSSPLPRTGPTVPSSPTIRDLFVESPANRRVLALAVALMAASCPAGAADWPQFRGPDGQGHSAETELPVHLERDRKRRLEDARRWTGLVVSGHSRCTNLDNDRDPRSRLSPSIVSRRRSRAKSCSTSRYFTKTTWCESTQRTAMLHQHRSSTMIASMSTSAATALLA